MNTLLVYILCLADKQTHEYSAWGKKSNEPFRWKPHHHSSKKAFNSQNFLGNIRLFRNKNMEHENMPFRFPRGNVPVTVIRKLETATLLNGFAKIKNKNLILLLFVIGFQFTVVYFFHPVLNKFDVVSHIVIGFRKRFQDSCDIFGDKLAPDNHPACKSSTLFRRKF